MAKLKVSFDFKKIDLNRIKQILLHTGEKIVFGIIVVLGLWLVWSGMSSARSANKDKDGKPLLDILKSGAKNYKDSIAQAQPPVVDPISTDRPWVPIRSHLPLSFAYFQQNEDPDQSRRNPKILPLYAEMKIDFLKAGISAYEIDVEKSKARIVIQPGKDKESGELGHTLLPKRMLIVSALFPLKEQIEEYMVALKQYHGIEKEEDKPFILGVNVYKLEKDLSDPMAKVEESPLYLHDPAKDKITVAENIDDLFRRALPDPDALKPFTNHRKFSMLITNMPKLASSEYPPLKLQVLDRQGRVVDGFVAVKAEKSADIKDKVDPKKKKKGFKDPPKEKEFSILDKKKDPKADAPVPAVDWIEWAESPAKEKSEQFGGLYPVFDGQSVGGDEPKKDDPAKAKFPMRDPPMNPNVKPPFPGKNKDKDKDKDDAEAIEPLIRFFDVDVKPGFAYAYKIQVRLKNPNFERPDLVALPELAQIKELTSPWSFTPFTAVPLEVPLYYATDQQDPEPPPEVKEKDKDKDHKLDPMNLKNPKGLVKEEPKKEKEEVKKGPQPRGPDYAKADAERVTVQIHRWFDWADPAAQRDIIADWVIAERLLVRRGEFIGRAQVVTEAPTWSVAKAGFEMVNDMPPEDPKKKHALPKPTGRKLDFTLGKNPPLLVDFEGGLRKLKGSQAEETPTELLILDGDGKLIIHNSQADTHDKPRMDRYEAYRERLTQYARPVVKEEEKKKDKDKGPMKGFK